MSWKFVGVLVFRYIFFVVFGGTTKVDAKYVAWKWLGTQNCIKVDGRWFIWFFSAFDG